jgi:hypothetical protein
VPFGPAVLWGAGVPVAPTVPAGAGVPSGPAAVRLGVLLGVFTGGDVAGVIAGAPPAAGPGLALAQALSVVTVPRVRARAIAGHNFIRPVCRRIGRAATCGGV